MFDFLRKNKQEKDPDPDIVILSRPGPTECGGTTATQDRSAPKTIESEDMILFDVCSAFHPAIDAQTPKNAEDRFIFVEAFAAKAGENAFLYLAKQTIREYDQAPVCAWALTRKDVFPDLVRLVKEYDFAAQNGFFSETHGLPQNFGGHAQIRYASGEKIRFSDNRAPIIPEEAGTRIAKIFTRAIESAPKDLPDDAALTAIRFEETRENGAYTKAALSILPDGTGTNRKEKCYEAPTVYQSQTPVEAETIAAIRKTIRNSGILAWADLPKSEYRQNEAKRLVFVFRNGAEITVPGDRLLPRALAGAFFDLELELSTRH